MAPKTTKSSSSSPSSSSSSTSSSTAGKSEPKTKIDPSFKSKRYRDKLRTEVKALEALLPVDRTSLSRKLDSQSVFRLVLALLRIKGYFQAVWKQPDSSSLSNCPYDVAASDDVDSDDVTSQVQGLACLQVLEGFLLVLTADGTILYVSDNVLQYLGYNQVDLMHRCLYSIVHRDDMMDLKTVLETSMSPLLSARYDHPRVRQEASHPMEDCSGMGGNTGSDICASLSFICRMRCFSGSSVGYLKMHCSGKMVHQPSLPRAKRTSSSQVALLFCHPFMLRATQLTPDLQNNVFWTKHDLDLHVTEMDAKGTDIIGFKPEEIEKQSFYCFVHPEDLTAMATCHKLLVDSSEVQTVYFRLQSKGGDWLWLTSRGKVISKNSKKFSIAFSHCPLREEDSTYIQQEAALRRRFALTDLAYLGSQLSTHTPHSHPDLPSSSSFSPTTTTFSSPSSSNNQNHHHHHHPNGNEEAQRQHPRPPSSLGAKPRRKALVAEGSLSAAGAVSSDGYSTGRTDVAVGGGGGVGGKGGEGRKEEVAQLDTSCVLEVACPSAWHAMSDRHSPVLPSSHVAHKLSQREKQLQFQEFCKRQQLMEANGAAANGHTAGASKFNTTTWDGGTVPLYAATTHAKDSVPSSTMSASQDILFSSARGDGDGCSNSVAGPNGFYPSGSGFGGLGLRATEYVPVTAAHAGSSVPPASFVHHWYSGASSVSMVNHHPSPNDSLTPCRSPHTQCGVAGAGSSLGGAVTTSRMENQFLAFQPQPPHCYGSVPVAQHVAVSAYSSMPPSPPPSPEPSTRSFLPPRATLDMESGDVQQQCYWPEVLQPWQSYYYYPVHQQQPMHAYYHRNEDDAVIPASSAPSMSTITDLQKTTEKFLPPLKKERQGESEEVVPEPQGQMGAVGVQGSSERTDQVQQAHTRYATENGYHTLSSDSSGRSQAWTLNGQLDISWRPSSTAASSQPFRQVNVNGSVNLQQSVANCSELPSSHQAYGYQGFQNTHLAHNYHSMLQASMTQPASQTYPYSTALYSHLGSRPANPYGVYAQIAYQGGQYPAVNGFYAAASNVVPPAKVPADFSRPPVERPLDLPSIGSFLEYLNEV